ncbi:hypothetical protein FQZ97_695420 [compost metagenome]
MQLVHRHIQLAALVVFKVQELLVALARVERHQAMVAADAVLAVHHRIAELQFGQVAHHRIDGGGLLLLAAAGAARGARVQLGFGDKGELPLWSRIGQREAALQRRHRDREMRFAGKERGKVVHRLRAQAAFGKQLQQRLAPAGGVGAHQHAGLLVEQQRFQVDQRVFGAPVDGDIGQDRRERRLVRAWLRLQHQARHRLGADEELLLGQEQVGRRQQRALAVVPHEVVALRGVGPEAADRLIDVAREGELRIRGQVVEQRRAFLEEQRQVVLDARRWHAVADVLVDRRLGRVTLEDFAPAAAERSTRGFVERELAARQQAHFLDRVQAALRVRVERADGLDLVAEQVDPVRQRRAHRVQVDQAAAHAVFARAHHGADVLVAGQRELRLQRGFVQALALLEEEGVGGQEGRRREPVQRGAGRHQHHVALPALDIVQRGQAFGDQVLVRREAVVGQRFPVGQQAHAQFGREPGDFLGQALGVDGIGAHHCQHRHACAVLPRVGGKSQCIGRATQAGHGVAQAGLDQRQVDEGQGKRSVRHVGNGSFKTTTPRRHRGRGSDRMLRAHGGTRPRRRARMRHGDGQGPYYRMRPGCLAGATAPALAQPPQLHFAIHFLLQPCPLAALP